MNGLSPLKEIKYPRLVVTWLCLMLANIKSEHGGCFISNKKTIVEWGEEVLEKADTTVAYLLKKDRQPYSFSRYGYRSKKANRQPANADKGAPMVIKTAVGAPSTSVI